jgi:hypothetical protein
MSRGVDLSTIDAVQETETVTFDFGKVLSSTSTITSAIVTCESVLGVDTLPSSRLVGLPAITVSPSTGASLAAVMHMFGSMVAGETYRVACQATISDGQILNLWTHMPCVTVS